MLGKNAVLITGITQRDNGEWLATIAQQLPDELIVLSVGIEDTEDAVLAWAGGSMQLMIDSGRDDVQLPDKYDRLHAN